MPLTCAAITLPKGSTSRSGSNGLLVLWSYGIIELQPTLPLSILMQAKMDDVSNHNLTSIYQPGLILTLLFMNSVL